MMFRVFFSILVKAKKKKNEKNIFVHYAHEYCKAYAFTGIFLLQKWKCSWKKNNALPWHHKMTTTRLFNFFFRVIIRSKSSEHTPLLIQYNTFINSTGVIRYLTLSVVWRPANRTCLESERRICTDRARRVRNPFRCTYCKLVI